VNKNLEYRRQFLLASKPIKELDHWSSIIINEYYLYSHPDLPVDVCAGDERSVALVGNIYDPGFKSKNNNDILEDIYNKAINIQAFFQAVKKYAGIYVLIYKNNRNFVAHSDALGLREIYYCTGSNRVVCGSQPNLLAKYAEPAISLSSDPDLIEFYKKIMTNSSWVGDETLYNGIKHLMPNHCLNIKEKDIFRYWPNKNIKKLSLHEGVSSACSFLKGAMESMENRHSLMVAVTAGCDSRTILAASKDIADRIYFFVNNENLGHKHPDISIPKSIFKAINLPFHVHDVSSEVDDLFREYFLKNVFLSNESLLHTVYNVYYKNHSDKVNVIGTGEIGRTRFGVDPGKINSYRISYKLGYRKGRYPLKQADKILEELKPESKKYGVSVLNLLYCEQYKGNRFVVENSKSDIAIEEIDPFASHSLIEVLLGVDPKYTGYTNNILFQEMIRYLWPELLGWPINPPYTFKDKMYSLLEKAGLFNPLKEFQYNLNYLRYLMTSKPH
jgi:hypothetical protein